MDLEYQDIDPIDPLDIRPQIQEKTYFSDTDTWGSWPNSPKFLTSAGIESSMDEVLSQLHKSAMSATQSNRPPVTKAPSSPGQKKRGRKPIRPNDPIKKKTEEKDKYWLRVFRGYMKTRFPEISQLLTNEEIHFWQDHLSSKGVPDKGNIYSSYGKKYKNHLFSQPSFVFYFQEWFYQYGEIELGRKCSPGSDLWFVFFDYASKELVNYVPTGCSSLDGLDSPKSPASPFSGNEDFDKEPVEFSMVALESDELIEFFLDKI